MTDQDFAKIKAAFPRLRWRWKWYAHSNVVVSGMTPAGCLEISRVFGLFLWRWVGRDGYVVADNRKEQTLANCLRSLRCAMRRQAKALNDMAGEA